MGIFSKIGDAIFGSEGKVDWEELRKIMAYDAELNRTDRQGMFTGWEWEKDDQGNPTGKQIQTIDPSFMGAVDRLRGSATREADPYTSPDQFSNLLDAKMANQMQRHGQDPGGFDPSSERYGRFARAYLPPSPQEGQPPPQAPGNVVQPPPGAVGGMPGGPGGKAPPGTVRPNAQQMTPEMMARLFGGT